MRDYYETTYNQIDFSFHKDMEGAEVYLPEAEVLLTYGEDLTPDLIRKAKKLKWIMVLSAGLDLMPMREIKEQNIIVTNSRGIHAIPMAEYAFAMFLQVYRQSNLLIQNQKKHIWDKEIPILEISEKTILILGAGAIGQEVARIAKAFRMRTIGVSQSGGDRNYFDEVHVASDTQKVLPEADFIVSVLPSTKQTSNCFRFEHFKMMKDSAIFLNMGRGDVVKSEVILRALNDGQIAHAILDVYEQEPLPTNSPLWDQDKITMTPHVSGRSPQYIPRAMDIFERNLNVYEDNGNNFINQVDVDRGY